MGCREALAIAMLVPLVITGCGGTGNSDAAKSPVNIGLATTATLSKAELSKRANAICAEANKWVKASQDDGLSPIGEADEAVEYFAMMVWALKELRAPQEDDGFSEFMVAADELETAADAYDLEYEFGDKPKLPSLERHAASALASFRATAQEYGLEKCATGPGVPDLGV